MTTELKEYILSQYFTNVPSEFDINQCRYDFFIANKVDENLPVSSSIFGDLCYQISQRYEDEPIKNIREMMENDLEDLSNLFKKLISSNSSRVLISKCEMVNEEDFEDLKQKPHAHIEREGTKDEFVTFVTVGGVL